MTLQPEPTTDGQIVQSHEAAKSLPNYRNALGNRPTTVAEFCSFLGNVLRSLPTTFRRCLFTSLALFFDCTGRGNNHRLLAAIPSLGLKPVACIGSFLGLSLETPVPFIFVSKDDINDKTATNCPPAA